MEIVRIITALYAIYMFVTPIIELKHHSKAYEYHIMNIILSIVLILFALFGSWTVFVVSAISILILFILLAIVRGLLTGYFKFLRQIIHLIISAGIVIWILHIF